MEKLTPKSLNKIPSKRCSLVGLLCKRGRLCHFWQWTFGPAQAWAMVYRHFSRWLVLSLRVWILNVPASIIVVNAWIALLYWLFHRCCSSSSKAYFWAKIHCVGLFFLSMVIVDLCSEFTIYICFVEYGPRTTLTPEQWRWLRSRGLSTSPSHEWLLSERWATMETPRRRISTQSYDPFLAWQVTNQRASASLVGLPSLPTTNYLLFSGSAIVPSGIVPNFTPRGCTPPSTPQRLDGKSTF